MLKRKLSYLRRLENELKKDAGFIIDDTSATKDHTHFIDRARIMFTHLLSNKKTTRANLSTIISSLMDTLIEKNKNKNKNKNKDVVIDEEEKNRMVEIIERSIENTSLKLNSKNKACRFPPAIFQIAHAIFSASGAVSKELNSMLPIFSRNPYLTKP